MTRARGRPAADRPSLPTPLLHSPLLHSVTKPPSRLRLVLLWTCSALALVLLVGSYAVALSRDTLPPGHPWHGISLTAMTAFFAVQTALHRAGLALRTVAVALPLIAVASMVVLLIERQA